jgi:hypothetical protein
VGNGGVEDAPVGLGGQVLVDYRVQSASQTTSAKVVILSEQSNESP